MKLTAVYPGTFDPITFGHIDIIQRAAKLFDRIIVAVAINTTKQSLFSFEERVTMAKMVLSDLSNVTVEGFDSLLIEFVRSQQASVILRGLRAVSDYEYEFQLAGMNRNLAPEIETLFLPTTDKHTFISSSLVKEVAGLGGDVGNFVPDPVALELRKKLG